MNDGIRNWLLGKRDRKTKEVFEALYDDDVVEEEDILKWHDAGVDGVDPDVHKPPAVDAQASAAFLAASEPFVTWLREAESDTEEE